MMTLLAARIAHAQRRLAGQGFPTSSDDRTRYQVKTYYCGTFSDPDTEARRALEHAAAELGICGALEVRWHVDPAAPLGFVDCATPRVVHLHRALRADTRQLRTVARHEAYHAAMSLKGRCACAGGSIDPIRDAELEHAANQFAMRYA